MTGRTAVLFLTHRWNPVVRMKFERLRREIGNQADVFALVQKSPETLRGLARAPAIQRAVFLFDAARLTRFLGYPYFEGPSIVPGSTHFPVLAFARRQTAYDKFLVIEFDVEFSGHWAELLDWATGSGADFVTTRMRSFVENPEWYFWPKFEPSEGDREWADDPRNRMVSFNPVYLASRGALDLIEEAHRAGWRAHYECLLATILTHGGCAILDWAKDSPFCIAGGQDPVPEDSDAVLSTVRYRPEVSVHEFRSRSTGRTLFHPVKEPWLYDGSRIVVVKPAPPKQGAA